MRDRGLSDLLGQFVAEGLRLVVLGACWTSELAELLAVAVPCVIGTAGPIGDQDCRTYSRTLYSSLAHGRSVGQSHAIARATADASGADADYLPDLRSSPDTIPEAEYLIGPQFRVPPARTPVKPRGGKLPGSPSAESRACNQPHPGSARREHFAVAYRAVLSTHHPLRASRR